MGGGDSLYDKIDRGMRGCKAVVSCVTQKYSLSPNCRREVSLADALKKPIIPLLLEQIKWPPDGPMSMVFTELLFINFYRDEAVQMTWRGEKFDELIGKLDEFLPALRSNAERKEKNTIPAIKDTNTGQSQGIVGKENVAGDRRETGRAVNMTSTNQKKTATNTSSTTGRVTSGVKRGDNKGSDEGKNMAVKDKHIAPTAKDSKLTNSNNRKSAGLVRSPQNNAATNPKSGSSGISTQANRRNIKDEAPDKNTPNVQDKAKPTPTNMATYSYDKGQNAETNAIISEKADVYASSDKNNSTITKTPQKTDNKNTGQGLVQSDATDRKSKGSSSKNNADVSNSNANGNIRETSDKKNVKTNDANQVSHNTRHVPIVTNEQQTAIRNTYGDTSNNSVELKLTEAKKLNASGNRKQQQNSNRQQGSVSDQNTSKSCVII